MAVIKQHQIGVSTAATTRDQLALPQPMHAVVWPLAGAADHPVPMTLVCLRRSDTTALAGCRRLPRDEAAMRSTAQDKTAKRVRQRVTFNAPPPETVEAYFRGGGREETEKGREGTGRQPAELRPQWGPMHNDDFRSAVVES